MSQEAAGTIPVNVPSQAANEQVVVETPPKDDVKDQARKMFYRACNWGLTNAIKQNQALSQAVVAKQLGDTGGSGEEGGNNTLDPKAIADLMEQLPFGSSINNLTINEGLPTPEEPATPAQPKSVEPQQPVVVTRSVEELGKPLETVQPVQPAQPLQPTQPGRPGVNPWLTGGLVSLAALLGAGGTYWKTRPEPPPPTNNKPIEFEGVLEWEATRGSSTTVDTGTKAGKLE